MYGGQFTSSTPLINQIFILTNWFTFSIFSWRKYMWRGRAWDMLSVLPRRGMSIIYKAMRLLLRGIRYHVLLPSVSFRVYHTHFEISGDPCNLIGSQQCDLFPNCTIFCSKSHHFLVHQNFKNQVSWNGQININMEKNLYDFKMGVV